MASVSQNPGLKVKANMSILIWVSCLLYMHVQVHVHRHQDQGVCYHRQMPESRTVCLESGKRCLNSRQTCREIRAGVPQNPVLNVKASMPTTRVSMPEIQDTVPRNQAQSVCYYRQLPTTSTKKLGMGFKMPEIKVNVHRNHGRCA